MLLSSLALVLVLPVKKTKGVFLGGDTTRHFITFPCFTVSSAPGAAYLGRAQGDTESVPSACPGQGQSRRALASTSPDKRTKYLVVFPQIISRAALGSAASQGKLVFHCSFTPDEVRISFIGKCLKTYSYLLMVFHIF